ncbi:MAG: DUF2461 domain-containing protein [Muribaculaceae bacterium]|nr:DUF2461 domain-containing protein [Muribaculaceae bacterium]
MKSASNIKEILAFLRQLEQNNDRTWFKSHKAEYDALRKPWEQDMERLIGMVADYDENVRGLAVKDCVYRIYRDIRFRKDKSPYKTYFSGVLGRGGRHTVMSSYYVHFQPGLLMMGGGIWWPEKPILNKLRSLIDAEPEEFLKIVNNKEITSRYSWDSETLKTMPKDYKADHPMAAYLRMKEYILMMRLDERYFDCDDWVERVAADLRPLKPLHDYLNYVFE